MKPQEFIGIVAPFAVQLRVEGSPIFPSVRIAQAALETGWRIHPWNNLVGYKVGSGQTTPYWHGASVNKDTWEVYNGKRSDEKANFRAYDSIEDGFRDQDLLFTIPRYAPVRAATSPEQQARALVQSGYATDPAYADKIISIIQAHGLKQYDIQAKEEADMLEEMKRQLEALTADHESTKKRLAALEARQSMPAIPDWAKEAVDAAVAAGVVNNPEGASWDFYRVLTVLHRKKLF